MNVVKAMLYAVLVGVGAILIAGRVVDAFTTSIFPTNLAKVSLFHDTFLIMVGTFSGMVVSKMLAD